MTDVSLIWSIIRRMYFVGHVYFSLENTSPISGLVPERAFLSTLDGEVGDKRYLYRTKFSIDRSMISITIFIKILI
jgi:hypothetical protein